MWKKYIKTVKHSTAGNCSVACLLDLSENFMLMLKMLVAHHKM